MKQHEMLYIDGQLANIGSTDITLEWKSGITANINKLSPSHSYTIKLPMTAANRKIFEYAESAEATAYALENNGTTKVGKRMSARYYCNGVDLLGDANAYLIGTQGDKYCVALTWGALNVLEQLMEEERTLPEIFGGENPPFPNNYVYWRFWTSSTLSGYTATPEHPAYGAVYGMREWACLKYANGVLGDQFYSYIYYRPSIKVLEILKMMFKYYDIPYDFNRTYVNEQGNTVTGVDPLLDKLYCPIVTQNDSPMAQAQNEVKWTFEPAATEAHGERTELESFTMPAYNDRILWAYRQKGDHNVRKWYGRFPDMEYKIKVHVRAFINKSNIDMTEAEVLANLRLVISNGIDAGDASDILALEPTFISSDWYDSNTSNGARYYEVRWEYDEWQTVNSNDTPSGDAWKKTYTGDEIIFKPFEARQGRTVSIKGYTRALIGSSNSDLKQNPRNSFNSNINLRTNAVPYVTSYESYVIFRPCLTTVYPTYDPQILNESKGLLNLSPIYLEPNLPDMKPSEFLKGIFYILGGYPVIANGTLKLVLYEDLVKNTANALDWSQRLIGDYTMPESINFTMDDWCQRNWLRWKNDDEESPKYSAFFNIENMYLKKEDDVFTLPFNGSDTERGMMKVPIYKQGKVVAFFKFMIQFWNNYELSVQRFDEVEGFVFNSGKPVIGVRKPANGDLDTLSFEELSFKTPNGLMNTRYKPLAAMLRNPFAVTAVFELDEFTLSNIDMSVPIFLRQFGSYFAIKKIKRKSDGKCTVELIKIPNSLIKTT